MPPPSGPAASSLAAASPRQQQLSPHAVTASSASAEASSQWTAHFSAQVGRPFFVHAASGRTSWEAPPQGDTVLNLPAGWTVCSSGSGLVFFFHEAKNLSSSVLPTASSGLGGGQESPTGSASSSSSGSSGGGGGLEILAHSPIGGLDGLLSGCGTGSSGGSSPGPGARSFFPLTASTPHADALNSPRAGEGPQQYFPPPKTAVQLPPGWKAIQNPGIGKMYYFREDTGETSWVVPLQ